MAATSCFGLARANTSKINDWLSLVANVAVVGGILFLAVELRQNNELLRSESRQALIANDVASLTTNVEHTDVFAASRWAFSKRCCPDRWRRR